VIKFGVMRTLLSGFVLSALLVVGCKGKSDEPVDPSRPLVTAPKTETTLPGGWKESKTSGFAIAFPGDWKSIDFTTGDFEKMVSDKFDKDPNFSGVGDSVKKLGQSGAYKLMVFAPNNTPSHFRPNCNVVVIEAPQDIKVEDAVGPNVDQLKSMLAPGEKTTVTYEDLPGGHVARLASVITMPQASRITDFAYLITKGKSLAVVTYSTTPDDAAAMEKTAEQSMRTFHFE
jgi:hypothetical protein